MQRPSPSGWRLDARLMTLLCKKITVVKSKELKTGSILQNLLRKAMAQKGPVLQPIMMNSAYIYFKIKV
jgi:hypothetical protein